jgi:glucosamine--fructose-6-phosphate aminotransferase (isomerizing)
VASLTNSLALDRLVKDLHVEKYRSIVLTGMGGSFQVLHPIYLKLIEQGFPVLMAETSELVHFMPRLLNPRTLVIAVSQSGRSAEMVRLLSKNGEGPTIVGVTNDPTSPLAQQAKVTVLIQAGPEASVGCKTATASIAALEWLGDSLCGKEPRATRDRLEQAAPAMEQYLSHWKAHVGALRDRLRDIRHFFVTGRGTSLTATGIGGLIMKEAAHFHSEGLSSAALRHGPIEMLAQGSFVLVFSGDRIAEPFNAGLIKDIRRTGAGAELAGPHAASAEFRLPIVPEEIRPIVEMLPLQMISLALAAMVGREAGKFVHLDKVTEVE